jgi:O-methyltransferase
MTWTKAALSDLIAERGYEVGDHSYGVPVVHTWFDTSAHLRIGRYCSFAGAVNILLGGNHRTNWVTTSPLPLIFGRSAGGIDTAACETSSGDVIIGNDVWIGQCVTILSGVTIGDGAVIGACAVVSKDIPPYAIAVGNPARIASTRFSDDLVARLLALRWWDWPDEYVARCADLLLSENVERLLNHPYETDVDNFVESSADITIHDQQPQRVSVVRDIREEEATKGMARASTDLYIDLLVKCISNTIYRDGNRGGWTHAGYDADARDGGTDWPEMAHSMVGTQRLTNLAELTQSVLREDIPGDLIEAGVWRGGACILMRGVLKAFDDKTRKVYVADSFRGLPEPDAERYPADIGQMIHTIDFLAISREAVAENFHAYGLLDQQVVFVEGWFKDTLPNLRATAFSLIRLDGDLYESTIQSLDALYPKLSVGGYVVIDDYGGWPNCRQAVHDYRELHGIVDAINTIDSTGVYWRRSR